MKKAVQARPDEDEQEIERRKRETERPPLGLRRANPEDERQRRADRAKELRQKNRLRGAGFR